MRNPDRPEVFTVEEVAKLAAYAKRHPVADDDAQMLVGYLLEECGVPTDVVAAGLADVWPEAAALVREASIKEGR